MFWRSLRSVLGYAWRALDGLRRVIHLVLMLAVLALVLAALAGRPPALPDAFALVVSPEGVLVEQYSGDALSRALETAQGLGRTQTLVADLVEAIDAAAGDHRVKVLHLELDYFGGGSLDKLQEVALALERFRATGKRVIASAVGLSHSQYYLAAHADEIFVDPNGGIMFQGFGFYRNYYRAALEKASVDWYVFSAGEAKSFGDPYVRDDMSPAERENLQPLADGIKNILKEETYPARASRVFFILAPMLSITPAAVCSASRTWIAETLGSRSVTAASSASSAAASARTEAMCMCGAFSSVPGAKITVKLTPTERQRTRRRLAISAVTSRTPGAVHTSSRKMNLLLFVWAT